MATSLGSGSLWSRRRAGVAAAVSAVYLLTFIGLDVLTAAFATTPGAVIWYPPAGLGLALLLIFGERYAPLLLASALISSFWTHTLPHSALSLVIWSLSLTLVYTLAALLLRRVAKIDLRLGRLRDVLWLALVSLVASCALALLAIGGGPGLDNPDAFVAALIEWWVGEFIGLLILTPFLLACVAPFVAPGRQPIDREVLRAELLQGKPVALAAIEAAAQAASIVLVLWISIGTEAGYRLQALYLCFLPLIWIALRRGIAAATVGALAIDAGVMIAAHLAGIEIADTARLQILVVVLSLTGLVLGALVSEHRRTLNRLRAADRRAIDQYERLLERLSTLAQQFGAARDLKTVFRGLKDFMMISTPSTTIFIALIEEGRRRVVYGFRDGRELDVRELPPMAFSDEVMITDELSAGEAQAAGAERARSAIAVPMAFRGQVIGSLEGMSEEPGAYGPEHATAMQMAANLAAAAIENVRLYEREREREEQLRQSQKMEAVGRLAGSIAHDFNNLLTAIIGYSHLLLGRMRQGDPMRAEIDEIRKAGERAASLTSQLLAFSRKQVVQPRLLDLNEVIADMGAMLRRLLGEDITFYTATDPSPCFVKADRSQLEQVILNLAINARDAMPQGGKLVLKTANREFEEPVHDHRVEIPPGRYVVLSVTDTGCGMTPEVQARIFEPFYTTKGLGKGTGMGLSMVYGIVQQGGGHILVYSEPGMGATFRLYFPRAEAPGEAASAMAPMAAAGEASGHETVLLVEDEETVRRMACEALKHRGYMVLEACDGRQAIDLAEAHKGEIDIVVTDVVMPEMGGRELAEQLAERWPELKVLFVSGYTGDAILRHGVLSANAAFLEKPFTPDRLARKVRDVLDGSDLSMG